MSLENYQKIPAYYKTCKTGQTFVVAIYIDKGMVAYHNFIYYCSVYTSHRLLNNCLKKSLNVGCDLIEVTYLGCC